MTTYTLPIGFRPETIVITDSGLAYTGSVGDGAIYRLDLRDGTGRVVVPGSGAPAGGIKLDGDLLFVAGGFAGDARVLDLRDGRTVASYQLATGRAALIADVVVTAEAAWFTDAFHPVLYEVRRDSGRVREVPLGGDVSYKEGDYNVGGISLTPDGLGLLIAQANTGGVFTVDTATGFASAIDLGGESLVSVDGLTLVGETVYAGLGMAGTVAVAELAPDGSSGRVTRRIQHPEFDVPSSACPFGGELFVVNSQLDGRELDPAAVYTIVSIPLP